MAPTITTIPPGLTDLTVHDGGTLTAVGSVSPWVWIAVVIAAIALFSLLVRHYPLPGKPFFPCFAITIVLSILAFDLLSQTEQWPFSSFPMYSYPQPDIYSRIDLALVFQNGTEQPIKLGMLTPLSDKHLHSSLRRAYLNGGPNQLFECVRSLVQVRASELKRLPGAKTVRVYRLDFRLSLRTRTPVRRLALFEVAIL